MSKRIRLEKKNNKFMYIVLIGAIAFVIWAFMSETKKSTGIKPMPETLSSSSVAPDFRLSSINGGSVQLSQHRGKVVIVDFWATWCPPCKAEIPGFIKLYSKYRNQGVEIIGVSVDEGGIGVTREFAHQYGINYPVVLGDMPTVQAYGGIRGIPTTFVIDRNGKIFRKYEGYRPDSVFEDDIKSLLITDSM